MALSDCSPLPSLLQRSAGHGKEAPVKEAPVTKSPTRERRGSTPWILDAGGAELSQEAVARLAHDGKDFVPRNHLEHLQDELSAAELDAAVAAICPLEGEAADQEGAPVLFVTGWFSTTLRGSLAAFQKHSRPGWCLVIGSWGQRGFRNLRLSGARPSRGIMTQAEDLLKWLQQVEATRSSDVASEGSGFSDLGSCSEGEGDAADKEDGEFAMMRPLVHYYCGGHMPSWQQAELWPPPGVQEQSWRLAGASGSGLEEDTQRSLRLAGSWPEAHEQHLPLPPPPLEPLWRGRSRHQGAANSAWFQVSYRWQGGRCGHRSVVGRRSHLRFELPRCALKREHLEICGEAKLQLQLRVDPAAFHGVDLFAYLVELPTPDSEDDSDTESEADKAAPIYITEGSARASEAMVNFALHPVCWRLAPDSRLALVLATGDPKHFVPYPKAPEAEEQRSAPEIVLGKSVLWLPIASEAAK